MGGSVLQRKNSQEELQQPIPERQVVACPMLSQFDTIVDIDYCKNKCPFFSKIIPKESSSVFPEIECSFPRKLKIYCMAK